MNDLKVPGLIAALLLAASCHVFEDRWLKREVKAEEVVGTWQLDPRCIPDLKHSGYEVGSEAASHTITLHRDGSCRFATFRTVDEERIDVLETECRWKLGDMGHQALLIDLQRDRIVGAYYYFDEDREGRLLLWQHLLDPDAWRYVEYVKVADSRVPE